MEMLWEALKKVAENYEVEVFPLSLWAKGYIPWTGEEESLREFDGILIKPKAVTAETTQAA